MSPAESAAHGAWREGAGGESLPPVVILCGGRGTRLRQRSGEVVKPLVEIGGRPLVWHVVMLYAAQGFRRFVLATGYRGQAVARFADAERWPPGVTVECLDTGEDRNTGGRVKLAGAHALAGGGGAFCATYADGVADLDLHALLAFHRDGARAATLTAVRPRLQFGIARIAADGAVTGFHEKPRSEHWINGGFFCFERELLEELGEDSVLEREPLERRAHAGRLGAFRHEGFWQCLDTHKDAVELNDLWEAGEAPWRLWQDASPALAAPALASAAGG